MTHQPAFDFDAAQAAKDAAIDQVAEGISESTKRELRAAVLAVANSQATFTTADVIVWLGDAYNAIREPRVMGAVLMALKKDKLIQPTPQYVPSGLAQNHNRPLRVWRANRETQS